MMDLLEFLTEIENIEDEIKIQKEVKSLKQKAIDKYEESNFSRIEETINCKGKDKCYNAKDLQNDSESSHSTLNAITVHSCLGGTKQKEKAMHKRCG